MFHLLRSIRFLQKGHCCSKATAAIPECPFPYICYSEGLGLDKPANMAKSHMSPRVSVRVRASARGKPCARSWDGLQPSPSLPPHRPPMPNQPPDSFLASFLSMPLKCHQQEHFFLQLKLLPGPLTTHTGVGQDRAELLTYCDTP